VRWGSGGGKGLNLSLPLCAAAASFFHLLQTVVIPNVA